MKSKQRSNQFISAGKRKNKERRVLRDAVIESAMIGRKRSGHTIKHCPYKIDTPAGKLWVKVFETGKDHQDKIGTVVADKDLSSEG